MKPTGLRAAVYTRLSRDPDGTETATARQAEDCRKLCRRNAWKVLTIYRDSDLSAYKKSVRRPEFERLLGDVHDGAIDVVVVWRLDRFTRQPRDLERFLDIAEPRRVALASCTEPFDVSNGMGLLMARQFAAFANYESAVKAERVARKHVELAAAGQLSGGGSRPFGYEEDRVTIRRDEARPIREAAKRVTAGETMRSILVDWTRRGVPTVSGKPWRTTSFKRMLLSPRIAGLRDHAKVGPVKASWPGIIDRDMHARLKAILTDPIRRKNGLGPARKYLLTGMACCGLCGARLIARPKLDHRRCYVCATGPGCSGCGKIRQLAEPLEALIAESIFQRLESPEFARAVRNGHGADDDGELIADMQTLEDRLTQVEDDHYVRGVLPRDRYLRVRSQLEDRLQAARTELAAHTGKKVLASVPATSAALRTAWENRGLDWRRALVGAVLERVVLGPAVKGRNFFDPDRVSITWRSEQ